MMNRIFGVLTLLVFMFAFQSCERDVSVQSIYQCQLGSFGELTEEGNIESVPVDFSVALQDFLGEYTENPGPFIVDGKSQSENDGVAKQFYDTEVNRIDMNIDKLEMELVGAAEKNQWSGTFYFEYRLVKAIVEGSTVDPVVAKKEYRIEL